ncbi:MAG: peptide chain release factor N(5)-glutamine methyltransferase [Acetobacter sp.]|nr:peptide chain release factor N(5)-glutamine methyltransferase [Acetobacter sp.]
MESLLRQGSQKLQQVGIENPRREAKLLLQYALGLSAEQIIGIARDQPVEAERYRTLLARRARREPLAYITAHKGFWTLDLKVSPATIVPRADTETIISTMLTYFPNRQQALSVLDLGTGTGCLLLAILAEYRFAWGVGVDINPQAVQLAYENIRRCKVEKRAWVFAGHWSDALDTEWRFESVVSNPPYIPTTDLQTLMPEVRDYEPFLALDGGSDGLEAYRALCQRLPLVLKDNGLAFLEIGINQAHSVCTIAQAYGLQVVAVTKDFSGIERVVVLRYSV